MFKLSSSQNHTSKISFKVKTQSSSGNIHIYKAISRERRSHVIENWTNIHTALVCCELLNDCDDWFSPLIHSSISNLNLYISAFCTIKVNLCPKILEMWKNIVTFSVHDSCLKLCGWAREKKKIYIYIFCSAIIFQTVPLEGQIKYFQMIIEVKGSFWSYPVSQPVIFLQTG